jgi:hypothetical protein
MTRTLTIIVFVLLPSALSAFHSVHRSGAATLELHCDNQHDGLALADVLTLTITIEADQPIVVEDWKPLAKHAPWTIVDQSPSRTNRSEDGKNRWQQSWFLAPAQPGDAVPLEIAALRWKQGDGDWRTATWPRQAIKVETSIHQPDPKSLRETTSIEDLPPRGSETTMAWRWTAFLVVAIGVFAFWWRRRRFDAQERDAYLDALHAWDRLTKRRQRGNGGADRFVTLLTLILRQYLEGRCQLSARRLTTTELLAALQQNSLLAPFEGSLATLLGRCDRVKYANAQLPPEACALLGDEVRALIVAMEAAMSSPADQIS